MKLIVLSYCQLHFILHSSIAEALALVVLEDKLKVLGLGFDNTVLSLVALVLGLGNGTECSVVVNTQIMKLPAATVS